MDHSDTVLGVSPLASVGGCVSGGSGNRAAADTRPSPPRLRSTTPPERTNEAAKKFFDIEAAADVAKFFGGPEEQAEEEIQDFSDDGEVCSQDPACSSNSKAESCNAEKEYTAAMAIQILETYDVQGLLDHLCYNGPASGFKEFASGVLQKHAATRTLGGVSDFVETLPSFEEWRSRSMPARRCF